MGTLLCRIELNKQSGITITVENAEETVLQTIAMDGVSITTTCKRGGQVSTITQKEDSVVIKCDRFVVDAGTITCTSQKETRHESKTTFDIKSLQDMGLNSSTNITEKATSKVDISGLEGSIKASTSLKLEGTTSVDVDSLMIKMKAKATLTAKSSGVANLEGSITNIKGSLVKIGS